MTSNQNVRVVALAGDTCITLDQGEPIYQTVHRALEGGNTVTLDFEGVSLCASPFLNGAIGRLLKDFKPETLEAHLQVENASPVTLRLMRRVIDNAKRYYNDPASRSALDAILDEEADPPDEPNSR